MQITALKTLSVLVLLATIAGCASKKTDDSRTVVETPEVAAATPAETAPPVAGSDMAPWTAEDAARAASESRAAAAAGASGSGGGWEGFESNKEHYTGDTGTRVVYFGFDQSGIPAAAYASLKAHAKHLAGKPAARLTINGHADERGTPEYNVALAERRAQSVVNFLVLNGASQSQLEVVSFGEEKPAELGHDEMSWAKNRRAELNYTAGQP